MDNEPQTGEQYKAHNKQTNKTGEQYKAHSKQTNKTGEQYKVYDIQQTNKTGERCKVQDGQTNKTGKQCKVHNKQIFKKQLVTGAKYRINRQTKQKNFIIRNRWNKSALNTFYDIKPSK